tara:strand:- start:283 stop:807 length:525 start_codon:yes stop_codon:yes gene_type:complete
MKKILGNKYTITILIVLIISVVLYYIVKNKKSNYNIGYMKLNGLKAKVPKAAMIDTAFCDSPEINVTLLDDGTAVYGCDRQCPAGTCPPPNDGQTYAADFEQIHGISFCPFQSNYISCVAHKGKCTQEDWLSDIIWYYDNGEKSSNTHFPSNGWKCLLKNTHRLNSSKTKYVKK